VSSVVMDQPPSPVFPSSDAGSPSFVQLAAASAVSDRVRKRNVFSRAVNQPKNCHKQIEATVQSCSQRVAQLFNEDGRWIPEETGIRVENSLVSYDSEESEEEWDKVVSKQHVEELLSSLHTDERAAMVHDLARWFEVHAVSAARDSAALGRQDQALQSDSKLTDQSVSAICHQLDLIQQDSYRSEFKLRAVAKDMKDSAGKLLTLRKQVATTQVADVEVEEKLNKDIEGQISHYRELALNKQREIDTLKDKSLLKFEEDEHEMLENQITQFEGDVRDTTARLQLMEERIRGVRDLESRYKKDGFAGCEDAEAPEHVRREMILIKDRVQKQNATEFETKREQFHKTMATPSTRELHMLEMEKNKQLDRRRDVEVQLAELEGMMVARGQLSAQDDIKPDDAPRLKVKLELELHEVESVMGEWHKKHEDTRRATETAVKTLMFMESQQEVFQRHLQRAKTAAEADLENLQDKDLGEVMMLHDFLSPADEQILSEIADLKKQIKETVGQLAQRQKEKDADFAKKAEEDLKAMTASVGHQQQSEELTAVQGMLATATATLDQNLAALWEGYEANNSLSQDLSELELTVRQFKPSQGGLIDLSAFYPEEEVEPPPVLRDKASRISAETGHLRQRWLRKLFRSEADHE